MELNAEWADRVTVEIADERFRPIADYSGDAAGRTDVARGFDCPVRWPAGNLTPLAGRPIRFRFHLKAADDTAPRLYAVYLKAAK